MHPRKIKPPINGATIKAVCKAARESPGQWKWAVDRLLEGREQEIPEGLLELLARRACELLPGVEHPAKL